MNGRLFLFGALKLVGQPDNFLDLGSPKTQSLLAYFALHRNQPIERRRLAFLLWPDTPESAARRNLRQYLHRLRQVLEPLNLSDALLTHPDGSRLIFSPGDSLWIDVAEFEQGTARAPQLFENIPANLPTLQATLDLYQGDLAPDIYEDWIEPLRAYWRQQYQELLRATVHHAQSQQATQAAISLAERLLQADPLCETSHRLLMACHYLNNDRPRALQQYERCRQVLQDELDVAPMPDTLALYQRIRDGLHLESSSDAVPPPPASRKVKPPPHPLAAILPPTVEPFAPPFISRRREIGQLDRALSQVEGRRGEFLLVQGESGVGKTRLVQEWAKTNGARLNLFSGQCREFEAMMPYQPLSEALSQSGGAELDWQWFEPPPLWLGSVAQVLPEVAHRYPNLPPAPAADGATDSYHLFEGLGRFIFTLALHSQRPLTLLLDDLHWADGATWQFLAYLGQRCPTMPLLVIGTCQSELLPAHAQRVLRSLQRRGQVTCLELARFSPQETCQLAGFLLDNPNPSRELLSYLYQETEGNPLFIIEVMNTWFDEGAKGQLEPATRRQVPAGIKSVIEARLDLLAERDRTLLSMAAAIGRTFSFRILAAASHLPEDEVVEALETWLERGLVIEQAAGYDFSHEKIQAVIYAEMSRARRRIVHRQIAQAIEEQIEDPDLRHPARLAHHYQLSDEPRRALPYLLKAGDMALAVRSYREAYEFGTQAMSLLRQLPNHGGERLDLNLQLAIAYAFTGEIERALPVLHEAERLARAAGDESRCARIFHRMAQLLWLRGQCRPADEYARRLLRSAEEQENAGLLHAALRMLGRAGIALGTYDDAIAYLLRYVKLDEAIHAPPDLPVIYGYLAVAYARVGAWRRAFEAGRRGIALAEATNSSSVLAVAHINLAFVYAERRHWSHCLELVRQTASFCAEVDFSPHCFMARSLTGRALAHLGETTEGIKTLRLAVAWARETDYRAMVYLSYLFLAEALLQAGQPGDALACLTEATPLIQEADDRWARAMTLRLQAEAEAQAPHPDWPVIEAALIQAATLLRQIRALPDLARTYLALRRLYDRAGQTGWAIDCHFRATTIFEELKMADELQAAYGYAAGEQGQTTPTLALSLRGPVQSH
jgi:DNA-binding SARP family transcriptional activator